MFQEAIDHCRWKKSLHPVLEKIDVDAYKGKTFEDCIIGIHCMFDMVKGVGLLAIYDVVAAICKFHKIHIARVYIIGNGPKRAIELLQLRAQVKKHYIGDNITIKYVEIQDIVNAFDVNQFVLDENMRVNTCGDTLETYICNWQKYRHC
jgi:hypothetical protein